MEVAGWALQPGRVRKEELGPNSAGRMGQARGGFLTAGGPGLGHQQTQPAEGSDAIVLRMEVRSAPGGRNQTFVGGAQREAPCSFGTALRPRDGRPTCTRLRGASGQGSTPGTGGPGVPSENPQPREEAHKRAESGGWSEFEAARPCPPPSLPVLPGLRGLGPGREWAPLAGPAAERAALAHAFVCLISSKAHSRFFSVKLFVV